MFVDVERVCCRCLDMQTNGKVESQLAKLISRKAVKVKRTLAMVSLGSRVSALEETRHTMSGYAIFSIV